MEEHKSDKWLLSFNPPERESELKCDVKSGKRWISQCLLNTPCMMTVMLLIVSDRKFE